MSINADTITLDLIIPIFNEEDVLPFLFERLETAFQPDRLREKQIERVHFIFVDDGSRDSSARLISERLHSGLPGSIIRLSRNFGHQNAVSAGLDFADADVVGVIDADLQDPPELVLDMVSRWKDGYDVVYAQRLRRKEAWWKLFGYRAFYRLVAYLSDFTIPLDSGDFCVMGRNVVDAIRNLPEGLRFPRVLRAWVGFKHVGYPYERPGRAAGKTKYSWQRLYKLATDGVAAASTRVLRLTQLFSFAFAMLASILFGIIVLKLLTGAHSPGDTMLLCLAALVAGGNFVQTLCLYILGAYVGRTYLEAKRRPPYLVMEVVGERERNTAGHPYASDPLKKHPR